MWRSPSCPIVNPIGARSTCSDRTTREISWSPATIVSRRPTSRAAAASSSSLPITAGLKPNRSATGRIASIIEGDTMAAGFQCRAASASQAGRQSLLVIAGNLRRLTAGPPRTAGPPGSLQRRRAVPGRVVRRRAPGSARRALQRLRRPHQPCPGRVVQRRTPGSARRALQRLRRPHRNAYPRAGATAARVVRAGGARRAGANGRRDERAVPRAVPPVRPRSGLRQRDGVGDGARPRQRQDRSDGDVRTRRASAQPPAVRLRPGDDGPGRPPASATQGSSITSTSTSGARRPR